MAVTPNQAKKLPSSAEDKENVTPINMKNVFKLGSSSVMSPYGTPGSKNTPFKILSDDEIAKTSKSGTKKIKSTKRHGLSTLQVSNQGKGTLVGKGRESLSIQEAFKKNNVKKDVKSSIESPSEAESVDATTTLPQTEESKDLLAEEAIALMKATDKPDDNYWRDIAEERRCALEEVINENEKLFDEIDALKTKNDKLKQKLNEAECFKILYENLKEEIKQKECL